MKTFASIVLTGRIAKISTRPIKNSDSTFTSINVLTERFARVSTDDHETITFKKANVTWYSVSIFNNSPYLELVRTLKWGDYVQVTGTLESTKSEEGREWLKVNVSKDPDSFCKVIDPNANKATSKPPIIDTSGMPGPAEGEYVLPVEEEDSDYIPY